MDVPGRTHPVPTNHRPCPWNVKRQVEMNVLAVDKKLLGKTFKQDQKKVLAALEALSEDEDESVRWSCVVIFACVLWTFGVRRDCARGPGRSALTNTYTPIPQ